MISISFSFKIDPPNIIFLLSTRSERDGKREKHAKVLSVKKRWILAITGETKEVWHVGITQKLILIFIIDILKYWSDYHTLPEKRLL